MWQVLFYAVLVAWLFSIRVRRDERDRHPARRSPTFGAAVDVNDYSRAVKLGGAPAAAHAGHFGRSESGHDVSSDPVRAHPDADSCWRHFRYRSVDTGGY